MSALLEVLDHCARRVPLYRDVAPPAPGETASAALARFPVLRRPRLLRAFPKELVPEGVSLSAALASGEISFVGTSGTGGERVQVLWSQPWWDTQELDGFAPHALAWAAVRGPGYREAVLTTPTCTGNLCHVGDLPMEARIDDDRVLFLNQKVDPALWSDRDVARMADELERFQPVGLEADPAYLAYLAARWARLGRTPHQPRFVELSYEQPSARHLAAIARVFPGVPVIDAYGSTECGFMLIACEAGSYHPNPRWHHLELAPLAGGRRPELARLLITPLGNRWLNLVRYDSGDLVRPQLEACPCGRAEPLLVASLEGRAKDAVIHAGGAVLTAREVDAALAPVAGLLHYRLVQAGPSSFEVDVVRDELDPLDLTETRDRLAAVLGAEPRVRVVKSVAVEPSGKFRLCRATHVDLDAQLAVAS